MSPIAGFVIQFKDGFLGIEGQSTDLNNARSFNSFEDAQAFGTDEQISEYVLEEGSRVLAYESLV